jgi:5-methylcytosine-specific restriction endonuclease McrA
MTIIQQGLFGPVELTPVHETASHKRRYKDYGDNWEELANLCLLAAGHLCVDCKKNKAINAHHIVPLTKGGENKLHNLKALCFYCHSKYHPHLGRRKGDLKL